MKAGILYNDGDIRLGDAPEPRIKPDEVLVQSLYAGICGTDVHIFRGEFHNRVKFPAIQGHEFGGVILEVGKEVNTFKAGDRVAVDPIISCHACPACLSGHINACRTLKLLGVDLDGGFGQYVAVPASHCFLMPENVPMEHVSMVEMYGLGHHVLRRGRVELGETVVILGAGKLGLSVLDVLCHSSNPVTSVITDLQPFRLDVAHKLGVDYTINIEDEDPYERVMEITQGVGADVVIECIGHYHLPHGQEDPELQAAPMAQAVRMIRNGGRIVTAGLGEQLTPVHFKTLVIKEAEIIATRVTLGEFPRALKLMSKGLLHADTLITGKVPLRDIGNAFGKVDSEDPETIKLVLDIQDV
jgi:L-gulonate 5-dehydrogenase